MDASAESYYQHVAFEDEPDENNNSSDVAGGGNRSIDEGGARRTVRNFTLMSVLFSANHGCVVSCLGLASARLGAIGAWQSGILYIAYTGSALLGATYIVKRSGARNALLLGMALYCVYVACFWVATLFHDDLEAQRVTAYCGAAIGGVGAGFLWTAQGAYFGQTAEDHAGRLQQPLTTSTAALAGIFAFCYLSEEVALRLLSTALLELGVASWGTIFAVYTAVTVISTLAMPLAYDYHKPEEETTIETYNDVFYKVTAAVQVLVRDPKMKYMVGLNAVFGFAAAFLNSYVNGQVVPVALNDPNSKYIGILSSWVSAVAAGMSLLFGRLAPTIGKGPILVLGSLCFFGVAFPFIVQPDATRYGWGLLIMVYTLHGTGRATFEGTLKATFADYFSYEKEGAFANIIVQNGLSGAIGYICKYPCRLRRHVRRILYDDHDDDTNNAVTLLIAI
jgi:MFS family permease